MFNKKALEPSCICKATCSKNVWVDVDLEVTWRSYNLFIDEMQEGKYICAHLLRKGVKGSTVDSQFVVLSNRIFTLWGFIFVSLNLPSSLVGVEISKNCFAYRMNLSKTILRRFWFHPSIPLGFWKCMVFFAFPAVGKPDPEVRSSGGVIGRLDVQIRICHCFPVKVSLICGYL